MYTNQSTTQIVLFLHNEGEEGTHALEDTENYY